jgi:predicted phosphodiesterase
MNTIPEDRREAPSPPPLLLRTVRTVVVLLAVGTGLAAASFGVSRALDVGPLTLTSRMTFGWPGETVVRVPPFGQARAHTHAGPARLEITVEAVDLPEVEQYLLGRSSGVPRDAASIGAQATQAEAIVSDVIDEETHQAANEIAWLALAAAVVAAGSALLVTLAFRAGSASAVVACVLSAAIVIGSSAIGAATFDSAALMQPRLEGGLAYVPQLQAVFTTRLTRVEALRVQASEIAGKLAAYYADPRSITAGGGFEDAYRVLHVTDLHLDPVGAELARSLARSYDVSLVIDTGDIAISGLDHETVLLPSLVVTSTPVVYIPGNHDSPAVNAALDVLPNVTVASLGTLTVDGMTIFAVPDPIARSFGVEPEPSVVAEETARAVAELDGQLAAGLPRPDIIAIHNPAMEREFVGRAAAILSGHTHSMRLYREQGTARLNSGTLGGMPYDPEASGRDRLPHSASILYYTREVPRTLLAIDRISVGVDGTTTLDRTIIDESLLP